jgi:hypothetical protein
LACGPASAQYSHAEYSTPLISRGMLVDLAREMR